MPNRTWHLNTLVLFPNDFPIPIGDGGEMQLPEQLVPVSRIPDEQVEIQGVHVRIREAAHQLPVDAALQFSTAEIVVRIEGEIETPEGAVSHGAPVLDEVLESLSFQMQFGMHTSSLDVLDMTGNPEVGELREHSTNGDFATPTFGRTAIPVQSLVGRQIPSLGVSLDRENRKVNRALDWYLKALSSRFETDHFICLWIACDLLAGEDATDVKAPYLTRCQHEITNCPECDEPIDRRVQGPTIKQWLVNEFGIEQSLANKIWDTRQILHGREAFDQNTIARLPSLNQTLRFVVVSALKAKLRLPAEEPPFVAPDGLTIIPGFGLVGQREVNENDLSAFAG